MNLTEQARRAYLEAIGIDVWLPRPEPGPVVATLAVESPAVESPTFERMEAATEAPGWQELRSAVATCTRCELHKGRTQTVFGVGDPQARWMFIGEAPGAEEDRRGEPFVGRAGKLLDEMLRAIGLDRQAVYIANTVKCRPPGNRNPAEEEMASCRPYLDRQIELIDPSIIIAVGKVAAQNLLGSEAPVGRLRGRQHQVGDIPLVVTYHPAYLLRSPAQKKLVWEDLCLARRLAGQEVRA